LVQVTHDIIGVKRILFGDQGIKPEAMGREQDFDGSGKDGNIAVFNNTFSILRDGAAANFNCDRLDQPAPAVTISNCKFRAQDDLPSLQVFAQFRVSNQNLAAGAHSGRFRLMVARLGAQTFTWIDIHGVQDMLRLRFTEKAAIPTTTELPTGFFAGYFNTTTGLFHIVKNQAGVVTESAGF